jgi:hypothetical protein
MARTDEDKVKAVLAPGKDYDTSGAPSLTRFITAANLVTTRVNTCATAKGYTLTSDELIEIETWLAAHYYTRSDTAYAAKNELGAGGTKQGQTAKRLEASFYGQTALDLDPSGCLAAIANGVKAAVAWGGKPRSEQTDYVDRD